MEPISCSIIGSFKKYYKDACELSKIFTASGLSVLSPLTSNIIDPEADFVILKSDNPNATPAEIQLIALHRIMRSSFVYVLAPNGYVGKTTCYEIGRIIEKRVPLFFSEKPIDIPIPISDDSVIGANDLIGYIKTYRTLPPVTYERLHSKIVHLHNCLLESRYLQENQLLQDVKCEE